MNKLCDQGSQLVNQTHTEVSQEKSKSIFSIRKSFSVALSFNKEIFSSSDTTDAIAASTLTCSQTAHIFQMTFMEASRCWQS